MAARVGIQAESAINARDQRTINTQEIVRVLRNCHEDLPSEELEEVLGDSMKLLQNSNYNKEYRVEILKSALKAVKMQRETDLKGETPFYRPRGYQKSERQLKKKMKKSKWFTKDGSKSFIMVPAMPGSKLKKKIEKRLNALNLPEKVKIVEKPGAKFSQILKANTKPGKRKECSDPKCLVGRTENGGNCRQNEVTYELVCKECKDIYIGETSRNTHARGLEHCDDSESKNIEKQEKSVMLRHSDEKHEGNVTEFSMKVHKAYQHDPLGRQCAEAVKIKNMDPKKLINNRTEYHQPGDVQVIYQENENEDIQKSKKVTNELNKDKNTLQSSQSKQNDKETNPNIMDFLRKMREKSKNQTQPISEEETYKCDKCDYKATQKYNLDAHVQQTHEDKNYSCDECDHKNNSCLHVFVVHVRPDYIFVLPYNHIYHIYKSLLHLLAGFDFCFFPSFFLRSP
jgi:hypothetical protein